MSLCVEKIVKHWFELGVVDDSEKSGFASRLIVVRKKISERDLEMIGKSVSEKTGKPVKITDPKQVYLIDPDLLEADVIGHIYRFCGDFRQINSETIDYFYLAPSSQEILDDVGIIANRDISSVPPEERRRIYSLLDISAAYNSVPVSPEDQHLLTCITHALRVIKWLRLPFGLRRAGTHFQSVMNKNLVKDMIAKGILLIYADDILVA